MMEWNRAFSQISPCFLTWELPSLALNHMAMSSICIFRQPRCMIFRITASKSLTFNHQYRKNNSWGCLAKWNSFYIQSFCQVWHKSELSAIYYTQSQKKRTVQKSVDCAGPYGPHWSNRWSSILPADPNWNWDCIEMNVVSNLHGKIRPCWGHLTLTRVTVEANESMVRFFWDWVYLKLSWRCPLTCRFLIGRWKWHHF